MVLEFVELCLPSASSVGPVDLYIEPIKKKPVSSFWWRPVYVPVNSLPTKGSYIYILIKSSYLFSAISITSNETTKSACKVWKKQHSLTLSRARECSFASFELSRGAFDSLRSRGCFFLHTAILHQQWWARAVQREHTASATKGKHSSVCELFHQWTYNDKA